MSHVLVIAAREMRERKFVFISAGIAALLSIGSVLLPDARQWGKEQVMMLTGAILSTAFALSLAIILGTSVVGRELTAKRMSFYFARPVSASSIWFGKLVGALATIAICAAIPLLPGVAMGGFSGLRTNLATPFQAVGVVCFLALIIFVLMHTASTMTRSRSPWIALDVVLLALAVTLGWIIVRPLLMVFALHTAVSLGVAVVISTTIALIASGAWQLSRGRADLWANHVALSKWTWGSVFLILLASAVFVAWLRSPDPGDLVYADIQQTSGDWIAVNGARKGFDDVNAAILLNTRTGAQERVAPFDPIISGDGSTAVWLERERASTDIGFMRVWRMSLDGEPQRRATGITLPPFGQRLLSDDGSRLASYTGGTLSIHHLRDSRLLGSARVVSDPGASVQMRFVTPQLVRVYVRRRVNGEPAVSVFEYDIENRALVQTAEARTTTGSHLRFSRDNRSVIDFGGKANDKSLALLDARTLEPLTILEGATNRSSLSTHFLHDGRIASWAGDGIRIYSASGQPLKDVSLKLKSRAGLVSEVAGGKLVVITGVGTHPNRHYTTMIVDIDRGVIERQVEGFTPVFWGGDPRSSAILLTRGKSEIWRWDANTGERKLIVKGS